MGRAIHGAGPGPGCACYSPGPSGGRARTSAPSLVAGVRLGGERGERMGGSSRLAGSSLSGRPRCRSDGRALTNPIGGLSALAWDRRARPFSRPFRRPGRAGPGEVLLADDRLGGRSIGRRKRARRGRDSVAAGGWSRLRRGCDRSRGLGCAPLRGSLDLLRGDRESGAAAVRAGVRAGRTGPSTARSTRPLPDPPGRTGGGPQQTRLRSVDRLAVRAPSLRGARERAHRGRA